MEGSEKSFFNLQTGKVRVAIRREQALGSCQQGSTPITLDAASLEDEVEVGFIGAMEGG